MINEFTSHRSNGGAALPSNGAIPKIPIALTIAGSDPTSGAGIQADLKTFAAHDVYGFSVITSITAQNTRGVRKISPVSLEDVRDQCNTLVEDFPVKFIKTGMISGEASCSFIADFISYNKLIAIVDTPFVASDGTSLMDQNTFQIFRSKLILNAELITPNISEAERLSGLKITSKKDIEKAASVIMDKNVKNVLIKGGHLDGELASDYFKTISDSYWIDAYRIPASMHGTGCILSASITANLALGKDLLTAIKDAKDFITAVIAASVSIGAGQKIFI